MYFFGENKQHYVLLSEIETGYEIQTIVGMSEQARQDIPRIQQTLSTARTTMI
jgi:hypothetical protein